MYLALGYWENNWIKYPFSDLATISGIREHFNLLYTIIIPSSTIAMFYWFRTRTTRVNKKTIFAFLFTSIGTLLYILFNTKDYPVLHLIFASIAYISMFMTQFLLSQKPYCNNAIFTKITVFFFIIQIVAIGVNLLIIGAVTAPSELLSISLMILWFYLFSYFAL
jgi:hypothetical protein